MVGDYLSAITYMRARGWRVGSCKSMLSAMLCICWAPMVYGLRIALLVIFIGSLNIEYLILHKPQECAHNSNPCGEHAVRRLVTRTVLVLGHP